MPECTSGRGRSPRQDTQAEKAKAGGQTAFQGSVVIPVERNASSFMSPHQAADSRTDRDEGVQRETHFLWLPLFDRYSRRQVTAASGSYAGHTQAYVDRTRSVCRTYAVHGIDSHGFFDGLFLAVFSEVLAVSSRISSFPQILGLSESRRLSPGWHSLDGSLPIWAVRGLGSQFLRVVSSSIGSEVRSELPGPSGSSGTTSSAAPPGQPFVLN